MAPYSMDLRSRVLRDWDAGRRRGGEVLGELRVGAPTAAATTRDRLDCTVSADPLAHAPAGAPSGPPPRRRTV